MYVCVSALIRITKGQVSCSTVFLDSNNNKRGIIVESPVCNILKGSIGMKRKEMQFIKSVSICKEL